jgi:hypothetical protein
MLLYLVQYIHLQCLELYFFRVLMAIWLEYRVEDACEILTCDVHANRRISLSCT